MSTREREGERQTTLSSISVSLSGFKSQIYQAFYKEFILIAVPSTWTDDQPYRPVGQFELLPPSNVNDEATQEATISQQNCPGGVTDANPDKLKNSISVDWVAPRHGQGCVSFKCVTSRVFSSIRRHLTSLLSRATVVRSDTMWFKDDQALTYTMCEDR